jgi:hypothetical protein
MPEAASTRIARPCTSFAALAWSGGRPANGFGRRSIASHQTSRSTVSTYHEGALGEIISAPATSARHSASASDRSYRRRQACSRPNDQPVEQEVQRWRHAFTPMAVTTISVAMAAAPAMKPASSMCTIEIEASLVWAP